MTVLHPGHLLGDTDHKTANRNPDFCKTCLSKLEDISDPELPLGAVKMADIPIGVDPEQEPVQVLTKTATTGVDTIEGADLELKPVKIAADPDNVARPNHTTIEEVIDEEAEPESCQKRIPKLMAKKAAILEKLATDNVARPYCTTVEEVIDEEAEPEPCLKRVPKPTVKKAAILKELVMKEAKKDAKRAHCNAQVEK